MATTLEVDERLERVTTRQAAKELHINIETLHYLLQQGKLPIGYVIKKDNAKRFSYYIYRGLLDSYKKEITG